MQWWQHSVIEKSFTDPHKIAEQVTSTATKICAVDLNINEHIAVCTVQTVEGTIIATRFIGGGWTRAGLRGAKVSVGLTKTISDRSSCEKKKTKRLQAAHKK